MLCDYTWYNICSASFLDISLICLYCTASTYVAWTAVLCMYVATSFMTMQVCALFVFGRNALEMRKFGLDFRTRPSRWRQITSIMGQGMCVDVLHVCLWYACMCVFVCFVCMHVWMYVCVCSVRIHVCMYGCVCCGFVL